MLIIPILVIATIIVFAPFFHDPDSFLGILGVLTGGCITGTIIIILIALEFVVCRHKGYDK